MKNKNIKTAVIVISVVLGIIAIYTLIRLYQSRTKLVTPGYPTTIPQVEESKCVVSFTIMTPTPSATSTSKPISLLLTPASFFSKFKEKYNIIVDLEKIIDNNYI